MDFSLSKINFKNMPNNKIESILFFYNSFLININVISNSYWHPFNNIIC